MKSAGLPALKLLISDIQRTEQGFAFEGLAYDRVWVQVGRLGAGLQARSSLALPPPPGSLPRLSPPPRWRCTAGHRGTANLLGAAAGRRHR